MCGWPRFISRSRRVAQTFIVPFSSLYIRVSGLSSATNKAGRRSERKKGTGGHNGAIVSERICEKRTLTNSEASDLSFFSPPNLGATSSTRPIERFYFAGDDCATTRSFCGFTWRLRRSISIRRCRTREQPDGAFGKSTTNIHRQFSTVQTTSGPT